MNEPLWTPSEAAIRATHLHRFQGMVRADFDGPADDEYESLHRWSLERRGAFWSSVWKYAGIVGDIGTAAGNPDAAFRPGPHMTDAVWFPGSELNFAENLLRPAECADTAVGNGPALICHAERGPVCVLSRCDLLAQATAFASFLRTIGVRPGDRVAAVVPNVPEAIVAMLGTTAIGAVWSSCSPDFGEDAVRDRFRQIEPTVLVTSATVAYAGKSIDLLAKVRSLLPNLPSVKTCVVAGAEAASLPSRALDWYWFADAVSRVPATFTFERFPFHHPVAVLYSSGTTGAPKCIVHGAGGTLLQHVKEHQLHCDIRLGDRVFYHTTAGWMMWNWLASALASGAAVVLYDGAPFHPKPEALWGLAERTATTHFGVGAKFLSLSEKLGVRPREGQSLESMRMVLSTGSPLPPAGFDYVYREVKADVCLSSIAGGTDIVSCFVLGCPTRPVYRGEIQVKGLGMDVRVLDAEGREVIGEAGELACASPFPSMPVGFWNDPDRSKYLASYFAVYPNVWCHGDWAEETPTGGMVIYGRSDTTLNPGGVRIGTAEIYRQVEAFPEVLESLATAFRRDGDEEIVLFLRMKVPGTLSDDFAAELKRRLRARCSPRHVPAFLLEAPDLPRTVSGKVSEVAVRNAINGLPINNEAALANPESLDYFRAHAAFAHATSPVRPNG